MTDRPMDTNGLLRSIGTLVIATLLASCGGGALVPTSAANSSAPASTTARPTPIPEAVSCPDPVVTFVEALEELDSRLTIGLNFTDYSERVGDARVAYDRIDVADLDEACLDQVAVPAEDALNAYVNAYTIWNDCISDADCDNDSITPELQAKWAEATELILTLREALDG